MSERAIDGRDRAITVLVATLIGGSAWALGCRVVAHGGASDGALRLWAAARAASAWGPAPSVEPTPIGLTIPSFLAGRFASLGFTGIDSLVAPAALLAGIIAGTIFLAARRAGAPVGQGLGSIAVLATSPLFLRASGDAALSLFPAAVFAALVAVLIWLENPAVVPSVAKSAPLGVLLLALVTADPDAPYALVALPLLLPIVLRDGGSLPRRLLVTGACVLPAITLLTIELGSHASRWLGVRHGVESLSSPASWPASLGPEAPLATLFLAPAAALCLSFLALAVLVIARHRVRAPLAGAVALIVPAFVGFEATAFEHLSEPNSWLLPLSLGVVVWIAHQRPRLQRHALAPLLACHLAAWAVGGSWYGADERAWRTALSGEPAGDFARATRSLVSLTGRMPMVAADEAMAYPLLALTPEIHHVLPVRRTSDAGLALRDLPLPHTIVVLSPDSPAGRADRMHELFPDLWEKGLADYECVQETAYWRIYRRCETLAVPI